MGPLLFRTPCTLSFLTKMNTTLLSHSSELYRRRLLKGTLKRSGPTPSSNFGDTKENPETLVLVQREIERRGDSKESLTNRYYSSSTFPDTGVSRRRGQPGHHGVSSENDSDPDT